MTAFQTFLNLFDERPDLFRKKTFGDETVYTFMKRNRYFGWVIIEKNGEKYIVPAIGKLQYGVYFRTSSENFDVFKHPSKYLTPHLGDEAPLLLKLDGFWLMAYELNDEIYYRTRTNPRIGKKSIIDKVINSRAFPKEDVERMVKDGYWPQFEVWGPELKVYNILFGGTRVEDLVEILGLEGRIFPNVLMIMDAREKKYITDYEKVRRLAEEYGLSTAPYLTEIGYHSKTIKLTPENIIEVMTYIQEFNTEHGDVEVEYEPAEYEHPELGHMEGIRVRIPAKNRVSAVVEGAVAHVYNGPVFEGYKIKPFTVMALDTFAKKYPPFERIKVEVFKVIGDQSPEEILLWMRDCKYAGKGEPCLGRLVSEVIDYLAEDYGVKIIENGEVKRIIPRKMARGVWVDVRKYFADLIVTNYPEIASIHPSDMNRKYGFDGKLIGYIVKKRSA